MFVLKSTYNKLLNLYKANGDLIKDLCLERARNIETIQCMADEIRSMDQLIFSMSQCTDWNSMRPYFNKLQSMQEQRSKKESDRITNIMREELLSVYVERLS